MACESLVNAATVGDDRASGRAKTLLVVEDNVLVRHAVAEALRGAGYSVLEASSVDEAKAILAAVPIDLLFLDLNMPAEGEGFAVAQLARARHPNAPVIFTSARVPHWLAPRLKDIGPLVRKPYLISKLLKLVRKSLNEKSE
jgi:CheY-like chemotaxis protein